MGCSPDFWFKTTSIRSLIVRSKLDTLVHWVSPPLLWSDLANTWRQSMTLTVWGSAIWGCAWHKCKNMGDRGLLADSLQFSTIMSVHTGILVITDHSCTYCVALGELLSSSGVMRTARKLCTWGARCSWRFVLFSKSNAVGKLRITLISLIGRDWCSGWTGQL